MKKFSFKKSIALIAIIAMLFSFVVPLNNVKAAGLVSNSYASQNPLTMLRYTSIESSGREGLDEDLIDVSSLEGEKYVKLDTENEALAGYISNGELVQQESQYQLAMIAYLIEKGQSEKSEFDMIVTSVDNTLSLNTKKVTMTVGNSYKGVYDVSSVTCESIFESLGYTNDSDDTAWKNFGIKLAENDETIYNECISNIEIKKYMTNKSNPVEALFMIIEDRKCSIDVSFSMSDGSEWSFVWGYDGKYDPSTDDGKTYGAYLVCTKSGTIATNMGTSKKEFSTELSYTAKVDDKEVGGETKDRVFYPSYDETNEKEDADVTATITSKTGSNITKINGVDLNEDGTANSEGWRYAELNGAIDKTSVVKDYKFDDYDNSTDNGMVTEEVTITDEDGQINEQTVSITWPFREIDHTYTESGEDVVETIETNLPIDPNNLEPGWSIVEGTDNHKQSRTIKKGTNVDEVTTVYQNGTGATVSVDSYKVWPNVATTAFPQTGEGILFIAVIGIVVVAVIIRKRMSNLKK